MVSLGDDRTSLEVNLIKKNCNLRKANKRDCLAYKANWMGRDLIVTFYGLASYSLIHDPEKAARRLGRKNSVLFRYAPGAIERFTTAVTDET